MKARRVDLQIRGMPAPLRDRLRRRAKRKGVSMSQYVIEVLKDDLGRPTLEEWWDETRKSPPLAGYEFSAVELVREGRRELGLED